MDLRVLRLESGDASAKTQPKIRLEEPPLEKKLPSVSVKLL